MCRLPRVSCPSARACTAVGNGNNTLAEHWNGTKWTIQRTRNPVIGADGNELVAVSCPSPNACTAVGDSNITNSRSDTLAEYWNGTKWAIQPTPKYPHGNESELTGVSCPSATVCIATGISGNIDTEVTLAEGWDGAKWVVQPTPNPPGYQGIELTMTSLSVSCASATACTAAGNYFNKSWTAVTLAEHWNGTRWKIQATLNPSDDAASLLASVSCSSATACTAVGPTSRNPAPSQPSPSITHDSNG